MKNVKKILLFAVLLIATNCIIPSAHAQGGFDDDTNDGPSDMPLDGNMTLMAAGGFAYIIKKVVNKTKQDK